MAAGRGGTTRAAASVWGVAPSTSGFTFAVTGAPGLHVSLSTGGEMAESNREAVHYITPSLHALTKSLAGYATGGEGVGPAGGRGAATRAVSTP